MTFTQAVASGFRRYFDFRTRSSRSEYWWWYLFGLLVGIATAILDVILFGGAEILNSISSLALLIPGLAVGVRRLHDLNRSGWWLLIGLTVIGILFPLLYWFVQPGTRGTNQYGPDPLLSPAEFGLEGVEGDRSSQARAGFCTNCGSALESGANFCRSCGTSI